MKKVMDYFLSLLNPKGPMVSMQDTKQQDEYRIFILCGFYCAVAISVLTFFGVVALIEGRAGYGIILIGFSLATCACYVIFWMSGKYGLAAHFVVLLMALLCLYMFYSGGAENTGILWYFAFPPLAIFLQEIQKGLMSVVTLMLVTFLVYYFKLLDFDSSRYSNVFVQRFIAVYSVITILSCLFALFRNQAEENLEKINERLEIISTTDVLTGLANRRRMDEILTDEVRRFDRFKQPFSLILLDIDHFKKVNDTWGHQNGDYVIKTVAELCKKFIRSIDTASRWGGEEYLILLPGTTLSNAKATAERLRVGINEYDFQLDGQTEKISASLGIAEFGKDSNLRNCIRRADKCLYLAKEQGRNRTVDESQL